jgi:hypothetical protein
MSGSCLRQPPTPAGVLACVALAVSLSGTAVAAGIVANAKHANRADLAVRALNADRLQGRTAVQIATAGATAGAQLPGPASSAAALVIVKTSPWSVAPGGRADVTLQCDAGQKAISGGWEDPGGSATFSVNRPSTDGGAWRMSVGVPAGATGLQSGTLYAVCLT